jgi:hypothetical protein
MSKEGPVNYLNVSGVSAFTPKNLENACADNRRYQQFI